MNRKTESILKKIAYGDGRDALRLLGGRQLTEEEIASLNIFDVAQIKISEKGGGEIRFVDRLDAIKMLEQLYDKQANENGNGFIEALKGSVK